VREEMTKLSEAKILGGIGALLSLFVVAPYAGPLIGLVGLILVFVAVKYIADETKDHNTFRNYLMNFILNIIAIGAVITIMVASFGLSGGFSWITTLLQKNNPPAGTIPGTYLITDFNTFWASFSPVVVGCVLALVIAWVLLIVGALYLRKSYNSIAEHTKVDLFKTTGLVYLIGAATVIIIIGAFILIIAKILEIVSFFSLPDNLPGTMEPPKAITP